MTTINNFFRNTDIKEINKLVKKGNKLSTKIKEAKELLKSLHNEEKEIKEDIHKVHTNLKSKAFLKISEAKTMNEITEEEYLDLLKHPYFNLNTFLDFQPLEVEKDKNEKIIKIEEDNNFEHTENQGEGDRIITYENENEHNQ